MAFSATILQTEKPTPSSTSTPSNGVAETLLSMMLLSVYGANMSKKNLRRLKRKFFWTSLKLKLKSLFTKPQQRVSDRTLIIIIAAVAFVVLLIVAPITALVLALVLLILYLAGVI